MEWALSKGRWSNYRFPAIDSRDPANLFIPVPNLLRTGIPLPGLFRCEENDPCRATTRAELACFASWKRILLTVSRINSSSGWVLLMEDDLGASLSVPYAWMHSLYDLINFCPRNTLAIQLSPISFHVREQLVSIWRQSYGQCLSVPKESVRSHGNGAVLLHKRALSYLIDPFLRFSDFLSSHLHLLLHPYRIRPVADKWIYGSLPPGSCQVATYPHFCLDAVDSNLHLDHVGSFHKPSRDTTINIWARDQRYPLIEAQQFWDNITG